MKNPLWRKPERWRVYGKPTKRSAVPRKIDEAICQLLRRAQRAVNRRRRI